MSEPLRTDANTTTTAPDRPELRKAIQEIVDSGFAGIQLRVHDERGTWVGSAGVSKLGESAEPPTDGHFRVGSITKTFTAALVLRLVAEDRIGLDTPADDYLPEFGLDRRITVRMLLQHTSGLFSFTGEMYEDGTIVPGGIAGMGQGWMDNQFRTYLPEELVRMALTEPARFEPGTDWSYSNTNYVLARLLIEKATARPYADEMRRLILEPLGLTGTVLPGASPEIPEPHAHGYYGYEDGGRWKVGDTTLFNPSWISAAGDMISTSRDLHTFFSTLVGGGLLPAPLLAEMCTPRPTPLPAMGYGLGVFVERTDDGGTILQHNGGFWGWASLMYSTPDGGRTLTGSLTSGEAELDLAGLSEAFEKAKRRLVEEVFGTRPTDGDGRAA
ncbi:serine hydrolase domain-containing protein [Streptomyces sp. NPDC058653]|uniref:serine hydrolase domain-containing protein n=1 Tax=Streptomyces sp. NPDC058653 TaxID=3346576 RepID=UPI0036622B70